MDLRAEFGDIDIYVFDQLLRGRLQPGMRVFDAGCGGGRNLVFLLRQGYRVFGNDANPAAIAQVRALAPDADFRVEAIEDTSFAEASADAVLASAVLHFARDDAHFAAMLQAMWRVLKPGGLFFARLASTIGIENQVRALDTGPAAPKLTPAAHTSGGGRFRLPDGSDRYLVDAAMLLAWTVRLGGELLDPIKTTVVHEQRAMTTWVARRK